MDQDLSPEALLEKILSGGVPAKEAVQLYQEALQLQRRSLEVKENAARLDEQKVKAENRRAAVAESVFVQVVEQSAKIDRLLELLAHMRNLVEDMVQTRIETVRLGVEELVLEISTSMARITEDLQEHDQRVHDALFFILSMMAVSDEDRMKARSILDPDHGMKIDDAEKMELLRSLQRRTRDAHARLRVLKEREAKFGPMSSPTHLIVEINETQVEINELEVALDALSKPSSNKREDQGGSTSMGWGSSDVSHVIPAGDS